MAKQKQKVESEKPESRISVPPEAEVKVGDTPDRQEPEPIVEAQAATDALGALTQFHAAVFAPQVPTDVPSPATVMALATHAQTDALLREMRATLAALIAATRMRIPSTDPALVAARQAIANADDYLNHLAEDAHVAG